MMKVRDRKSRVEARYAALLDGCWLCGSHDGVKRVGGIVRMCASHRKEDDARMAGMARRFGSFSNRSNYYILDRQGNPTPCESALVWGMWMERAWRTGKKHVGNDTINGYQISTVFLGLDHNYFDAGPPVLWETMIFPPTHDDALDESYMERYTSKEAARANHERLVQMMEFEARAAGELTKGLITRMRERHEI